MLQNITLLFCLILCSVNSTYISLFTDDIVSGKVKADCDFNLSYTDSHFTKTKVSCGRISKGKIIVDYIHEAKSLHILNLRLRISRSGKTKVLSSSVQKSKQIHTVPELVLVDLKPSLIVKDWVLALFSPVCLVEYPNTIGCCLFFKNALNFKHIQS